MPTRPQTTATEPTPRALIAFAHAQGAGAIEERGPRGHRYVRVSGDAATVNAVLEHVVFDLRLRSQRLNVRCLRVSFGK